MRNFILVIVAVAALWLLFGRGAAGPKGDIAWNTNATAALSAASVNDATRPSVVVFTASWCPPCQEMKESTWPDARVARAMKKYNAVWADVDQHGQLAQRFGVQSIPTVVLLDQNAREIGRSSGFVSPEEMVAWLGE
jgi:thiol:disulfide interchange protein